MDNCFEQELFALTKKEAKLAFNIIANRHKNTRNSSVSNAIKLRSYQKLKSWNKVAFLDERSKN
ncbi:hypothetical protein [Chondrinema litorale]|uniref:hypothetical protein n=1 Tax=Chondrinema litorale TaxID=2994555 RepID=UPI0025428880|nr:hypothetical protein [Chondrinema litorale]UZR97098.1 hypothetical protein OQ292_23655 [Chondrinema litorale]